MARLVDEAVIKPGDLVGFDTSRHTGLRLWTDWTDDEHTMANDCAVTIPTRAVFCVLWVSNVCHPRFITDDSSLIPHKTLVVANNGIVGFTWSTYVKRV